MLANGFSISRDDVWDKLLAERTSNFQDCSSGDKIIGFKNREYYLGEVVRGYRDLNSRDSQYFSIMAKGGKYAGKVLDHGVSVAIEHAVFNVRKGGQVRVRKERRRNVHAFVVGRLVSLLKGGAAVLEGDWIEVTYNPFFTDSFIEKATGRTVASAKTAVLQSGSVFCQGVTFG